MDEQQQEAPQQQQGESGGKGTAVKAAAAAAATSVAALAAKKAWSSRGSTNGQSRDGGSSSGGDPVSVLSSVLTSGWDAARDALLPAAEDVAGAAGEYLAKSGPEIIRERIVPRFIELFNEAQAGT